MKKDYVKIKYQLCAISIVSLLVLLPAVQRLYSSYEEKAILADIKEQEEAMQPIRKVQETIPKSVPAASTNESVPNKNAEEDIEKEAEALNKYLEAPAFTVIPQAELIQLDSDCFFFEEPLSDEVFNRIQGKSYRNDCTVAREDLRYIRVLCYGFDKQVHIGEIIVNKAIAEDIVEIFRNLYDAKYPIERMVLVDEYDADDESSMEANNTSAFNFRSIEGTSILSNHSSGMAIDINPFYNPCVINNSQGTVCEPKNAAAYMDREKASDYMIDKDDLCYQLFTDHGFTWGGDWKNPKDYQHFEK